MPPRPALDQQVTFLYAQDPAACWDFYERVMELPLVQDQGRVRIYAVDTASRAFLGVCQAAGPRAGRDPRDEGGVCFTFVAQDVDGWHAFLTAKGVDLPGPAHSAAYRIHHFFLRDPAGNLLEVQRFERPDWPPPA